MIYEVAVQFSSQASRVQQGAGIRNCFAGGQARASQR